MKKISLIVTTLIVTSLLLICTTGWNKKSNDDHKNTKNFELVSDGLEPIDETIGEYIIEIRDKETGVHYLIAPKGVTVMYDSQGNIKVD
jgi:hypothetical protein